MKILITVIIVVAVLAFKIYKIYLDITLFNRDAYDKTFVCPNCGARFNVKWYQMIFKTESVHTYNATHLRCPVCHQKDMCSVAHEER